MKSELKKLAPPGTHMHRVVPSWEGGEYVEDNVVFLTRDEHRIAHEERFAKYGHAYDGWAANRLGGHESGQKHTDEAKAKIGEASRTRVRKKESYDKVAAKLRGRVYSAETLEKMSNSHMGKTIPDEVRIKIGLSHKGKVVSEETKNKMRKPQKVCVCPHCGKEGGHAMKRWHFDSCNMRSKDNG